MLSFVAEFESSFGPLRLFGYLTLRAAFAGVTALLLGLYCGPWIVARLHRLRAQQSLRSQAEVGALADLHAEKGETPTMGGLIICLALVSSVLLWAAPNVYVFTALFVYLGLTLLGFIDDYLKVVQRSSRGLSGRYKLLGQGLVTIGSLVILFAVPETSQKMRELWVPFYKNILCSELPLYLLLPFLFLILSGSSNAINLTDGVDGLAIGCAVTGGFGLFNYGLRSG